MLAFEFFSNYSRCLSQDCSKHKSFNQVVKLFCAIVNFDQVCNSPSRWDSNVCNFSSRASNNALQVIDFNIVCRSLSYVFWHFDSFQESPTRLLFDKWEPNSNSLSKAVHCKWEKTKLHFIKSWMCNKIDKCFKPPTSYQKCLKCFRNLTRKKKLDETRFPRNNYNWSLFRLVFDEQEDINYGSVMLVQGTCCFMPFCFCEIDKEEGNFKRSNSK